MQAKLHKPQDYKPPFSRAGKVPRTDANYRVTEGNIAAIDFGTTSVSLAYTTKGDDMVSMLLLDTEQTRLPNSVFFMREGKAISVAAIGNNAAMYFSSLRRNFEYVYFERIDILKVSCSVTITIISFIIL